jgi:iron complex transport system substrate-binding protein
MDTKRLAASLAWIALLLFWTEGLASTRFITDALGRRVQIPEKVERVICSGSGCLRLLVYLQAQDKIVAVDDIEKRRRRLDARPYALANPQLRTYPIFGQFRGHDHPERIIALAPQVILKTFSTMGHDPVELQQKTGIPVVVLNYGDLGRYRHQFFQALEIMGSVVQKSRRAETVIRFFENQIAELDSRTASVAQACKPTCFVGGIAFKGPHGFQSTEPGYPPFAFIRANHLPRADTMNGQVLRHSNISKEQIVQWDPHHLFLDLSSLQMGDKAGGLYELRTDPAYRSLTAVRHGRVYGLLPYNWYTKNFGSILANAFYLGKCLYPDRFTDVNPIAKADAIYTFLVGKPVFRQMDQAFDNLVFKPIPLAE